MKFVTVKDHQHTYVGLLVSNEKFVLPIHKAEQKLFGETTLPASLLDCIALGDIFIQKVVKMKGSNQIDELLVSIEDVVMLAPIPRPAKNIFCVGKNYEDHAIEMGSKEDIPEHVMVFTKAPTTVIGTNGTVLNYKELTTQLDYEGELALVIGKKGKGIKPEEALDYIFGYTIINDITARDIQTRHKQFFIGKSLDTTCPMGPSIVHASAIKNPNQLNIQTTVNGELRQNSNTENFIFPIEEIIAVLSQGMTLEPGDIIATGTPSGVGKGFKPPRYLQPGDVMEVTVEGIGTLVNKIEE